MAACQLSAHCPGMHNSRLFTTTAVIEAATGIALMIAPGVVVALLVGAQRTQ